MDHGGMGARSHVHGDAVVLLVTGPAHAVDRTIGFGAGHAPDHQGSGDRSRHRRASVRYAPLALGLAMLMLAGCGDGNGPPVVQVSGAGAVPQSLQAQITSLQSQVSVLQERVAALEARLAAPR
jgi:hypothetical protein